MRRVVPLACGVIALLIALALPVSPGPIRAGARPLAQGDLRLAGQFLVATPDLRDPRFARTVIYMLRHDATGAMGLIVNRPVRDVSLAELLRRLGVDEPGAGGSIRLHYGGPVEPASGFLLHTVEYATHGTERIAGDVALTPLPALTAALGDIARGAGPRRYLLALGYAGWAPGQLEGEIDGGAWITVPADAALLFDDDHARKWERATARRRLTI
jgi:putative transcriptional regulator